MKKLLPILLSLLCISAYAETKQYSVKVLDFANKNPIEKAFVRIVDLKSNKVSSVLTDISGKAAMELDISTQYRIDIGKRTNQEDIRYITYSFFLSSSEISKPVITEVMLEKVKINSTVNLSNLYFEPGQAELDGNDKVALANALIALNTSPALMIEIGIRADCKESEDIAAQRTELVQKYFATKGNYSQRIIIKNYGKSSQLAGCNCDSPALYTDDAYAANRVAEFKVISF